MNVNYYFPEFFVSFSVLHLISGKRFTSIKRKSGCISVHLNNTEKTLKLFGLKLTKLGQNNIL